MFVLHNSLPLGHTDPPYVTPSYLLPVNSRYSTLPQPSYVPFLSDRNVIPYKNHNLGYYTDVPVPRSRRPHTLPVTSRLVNRCPGSGPKGATSVGRRTRGTPLESSPLSLSQYTFLHRSFSL